jgi:hypothetical protein
MAADLAHAFKPLSGILSRCIQKRDMAVFTHNRTGLLRGFPPLPYSPFPRFPRFASFPCLRTEKKL